MSSPDELSSILRNFIEPWYASLKDPRRSQRQVLDVLLQGYRKTGYGTVHDADRVSTIEEFQSSFPISNYKSLQPYFDSVRNGNYSSIMSEPVSNWVMTRGTTGHPKIIPVTQTHLDQILLAGARAIINFALKKGDRILRRNVLNLNFPSQVLSISTGRGAEEVGYSSGTYARLHPSLDEIALVPKQEEIDSLGGGITNGDWERRFELVYNVARSKDVGCVMGVTPVILAFGRFVKRRFGLFPKSIWKMSALFCTSVPKIHTKYASELSYYFGDVPVVEMYTATEGVFGQQLDENPYFCPNFDVYFFEVKTRRGTKLLFDLAPNEWGSLIVSSVLFPRYEIGDLIESVDKGYFRVFGREKSLTILEHLFYNALTGRTSRF